MTADAQAEPAPSRLLAAVVQFRDASNAEEALKNIGLFVNRLPSAGGFLGQASETLLIAIDPAQEEQAIAVLHDACRTRTEYLASPLEGTPIPLTHPVPVRVGGATIFSFDLERYVEL